MGLDVSVTLCLEGLHNVGRRDTSDDNVAVLLEVLDDRDSVRCITTQDNCNGVGVRENRQKIKQRNLPTTCLRSPDEVAAVRTLFFGRERRYRWHTKTPTPAAATPVAFQGWLATQVVPRFNILPGITDGGGGGGGGGGT